MFLEYVSEFVEFLAVKDHTLEEILGHMVLRTLTPLEATSAFLFELTKDNHVESIARYGATPFLREQYPNSFDLRERIPITDCIKTRKVVWINTLPHWPDEYSTLQAIPFTEPEKTFICFPIEKCGTPIAVLGIFCAPVVEPDAEIDAFMRTIGNLFSLHVYRSLDTPAPQRVLKHKSTLSSPDSHTGKLTERQYLILRMMSEGRTNVGISELLGYSESTIRQETIKIFAKLGCHGREEASRIYREELAAEPAK